MNTPQCTIGPMTWYSFWILFCCHMQLSSQNHNVSIILALFVYIYILGCIVCPSPAQILDFFGLQVKNHQYKKKIKLEVISSFFMAMVSNTVFLEFFNNSWIWKIEKNSYVFLNLTFYVRNVPNQSKKSNNYWNLFLSILFLVRNFAHFLYYLFLLIGCQNIDCSCTFFFWGICHA